MRREVVRCSADGFRALGPRTAPLVPDGADFQGADAGALAVGASGAPAVQQALFRRLQQDLVPPSGVGRVGPAARDAPLPVSETGT